jgi:hypothetical protein
MAGFLVFLGHVLPIKIWILNLKEFVEIVLLWVHQLQIVDMQNRLIIEMPLAKLCAEIIQNKFEYVFFAWFLPQTFIV